MRGVSWEWDPEAQFLATRGYAVIQPEFRGSTGFGYDHFHAGWHQWGLAMQDDLADAAAWAVAQGYALPGQVAIGGSDAAQIEHTSPLKNAQRLTRPLLMAYGADDVRVPITHGTEFRDAVMRTNKNVEWLVYNREGHGLRQEDHRIDYWKHVEAFLDRCFRSSPAQTPDNRPDSAR